MIKAYSYIRMSSGRQLKGDSLIRQLELSEAFAAEHELDLDTSLRDLGVSAFDGSNREKGALATFLRKVASGEIEKGSYLLVESLDRLSRDHVLKALRVFQDILEAGVVIATVADGYIYSEETINKDWTQLIVSLAVMSRAHEESQRKAERLRGAWVRKRANRGFKMTKRVPGWLTLNADRTGFVPNDHRVRLVNSVLEDMASGIGRDKIARRLNAAEEETWGGGREWHGGTVQKLTDNPAVLGHFQPHRIETTVSNGVKRQRRIPVGDVIEDYYPRIVSDELWLRARRASDARARTGKGNAGGRRGTVFSNLASGLCRCAACGSPMNYRDPGVRSVPKLRCSGERNGTCSNTTRIPYPDLERGVIAWARFHEPSPAPRDDRAVEQVAAAERNRDAVAVKVERLIDAIESGELVAGRLAERREELAEADRALAAARKELSLASAGPNAEALRGAFGKLDAVAHLPREERFAARAEANQVLRGLVREVRCHPSGKVDLHFDTYGEHLVFEGPKPDLHSWPILPASPQDERGPEDEGTR